MGRIPPLEPAPTDDAVALREWRDADVPAIAAACADEGIQRWTMVPDGYTEKDARTFVAHARRSREADASLDLAVVDAADHGTVLGAVGLVRIDWTRERAEIGYWTAPHARSRGVAVRAVRLLAAWSFDELRLARLEAMPFAENAASQAVAERAGFTREGILRSYYRSKRGLVDVAMYSLLRSDP